jgi:2-keto-4-pentenoate hydratase/2-oxohepta-3-ene-1,7-dioic acid hydratase in catechol pathway
MKIIRFVGEDDRIIYGAFNPGEPDRASVIEGDIFGIYRVSADRSAIKRLLAPIAPINILALGINYKKHGDETEISYPEQPVLFLKATTSVIGPGDPIMLPAAGGMEVDYEAELAVVVGKTAKNVPPERAMEYIMGYTCANDVSARDWQIKKQKKQWARGKSFDTFCPLGPWIVTKDEIDNPDSLGIRTIVNDRVLQDAVTSDMIFNVRQIVSNLSMSMTLLPGTVILTGTPEGVGFTRQPPIYLREGDTVHIEIERIGRLSNPVVMEKL